MEFKEYSHKDVPRHWDFKGQRSDESSAEGTLVTTLMIRNIPNRYTQAELMDELTLLGYGGSIDFLYMPLDRGSKANVGYAFVNFIAVKAASDCRGALHGYKFIRHGKDKVAIVSAAHLQGFAANFDHYHTRAISTTRTSLHRPLIRSGCRPRTP